MIFSSDENSPLDRQYFTNGVAGENILALGKCSYLSDAEFQIAGDYYGKHPHNILIGRFTSIARNLRCIIGENHSFIGTATTFPFDDQNRVNALCKNSELAAVPKAPTNAEMYRNHNQIIIGNDVWIGRGVTIMGGVRIGSGAILGAGAVVAKSIPPYAIAVGNPARVIKYRFDADTIKIFMALKWWNWDIEKIIANIPIIKDAEKFLAEHYAEAEERLSYAQIPEGGGIGLEKYLAEGREIYSFVADFHAVQPLWKRIVSGFLKANLKNAVLLFGITEDMTQQDFDDIVNFINALGISDGKKIHFVPPPFSPYLLRNSTHFITTREFVTLECLDWLYDSKVKIISALDDNIFEGEPAVVWEEIYK